MSINQFAAGVSATGVETLTGVAFRLGPRLENLVVATRLTGNGTATLGLEYSNHESPTSDDWWAYPIRDDEELPVSSAAPKNSFEIMEVCAVWGRLVWHNLTGTNTPEAYVARKSRR